MGWFNKMTVGGRLVFGFAVMIFVTAVVGTQGFLGTRQVNSRLESIFDTRMPAIGLLVEADRDLQQALVAERSMVFANASSEQFKGLVETYEENVEQAWTRWNKYKDLATTQEERDVIPAFESAWEEWTVLSRRVVDGRIEDTRTGRRAALDLTLGQANTSFEAMRDHIDKLTEINQGLAHQDDAAGHATYVRSARTQIALGLFCALLGIGLALVIRRSIAGPLQRVIDHLDTASSQLTAAATQIEAAAQGLADGSSQQAAAVEETSASLEEMSSMTRTNAENVQRADKLMKEANIVVAKADQEMEQLDISMQDITAASVETQKIVKTIDEISFQTNLLALNAAVEAARAGDAGKGFAVVAEEVRGLAKRAAEAARSTADQIEGTVAKINTGSELVSSTIKGFRDVAENTTEIGELLGSIASASGEQAQGVDQINRAVTDIDHVTQSNASTSEESASAAAEMTRQASHLRTFIADLQTLVGGQIDRRAPATARAPRKAAARPASVDDFDLDDDFFAEAEAGFEEEISV